MSMNQDQPPVSPYTEPQRPRPSDDLPEHRVAMVVFTTVRAVNNADAAFIARKAIVDAFTDSLVLRPYQPVTVMAQFRDDQVPVVISEVTDLSSAGLSGYVWIQSSNRAYPRPDGEVS